MDKTQINVERMRACDAEWEEQKHPRAGNGQFTSGSGSAGGSAKPSAESAAKSPLQKAAAAVQGKSSTRLQRDLDAVAEDPHELEGILRERKAEIDRLTEELGRTKNGYKSQALHQEITRLKREYKEIDESI